MGLRSSGSGVAGRRGCQLLRGCGVNKVGAIIEVTRGRTRIGMILTSDTSTLVNTLINITNHPLTNESALLILEPLNHKGEAGPEQRTSDIASVIQEIVDQTGWMEGNSLVILIIGEGKRVAESYNGDRSGAPLLHIEYYPGN